MEQDDSVDMDIDEHNNGFCLCSNITPPGDLCISCGKVGRTKWANLCNHEVSAGTIMCSKCGSLVYTRHQQCKEVHATGVLCNECGTLPGANNGEGMSE